MNVRVPPTIVMTIGLLVAACAVGSTPVPSSTPMATPTPTVIPSPSPSPTLIPTLPLSPSPPPTTSGAGPAYVRGTQTYPTIERGEASQVGDVLELRGNSVETIDTMDDPRVTGTGTILGDADLYGSVGPQWGTYRLENANGAWEGTWTGALWQAGAMTQVTAWLVGSGAYEGWTYYLHARGTGTVEVEGIVFPGSPPTP